MIVFSLLMYYSEHDDNPAEFPSLSEAIYWGIATMSSIGSPHMPVTASGKLVLSCACREQLNSSAFVERGDRARGAPCRQVSQFWVSSRLLSPLVSSRRGSCRA